MKALNRGVRAVSYILVQCEYGRTHPRQENAPKISQSVTGGQCNETSYT